MKTNLLTIATILTLFTIINVAKGSHIETMSFTKMTFKDRVTLQKYPILNESFIPLNIKGLTPKDNYTLDLNLSIKTNEDYAFWTDQLRTLNITPFVENKIYNMKELMPTPLKRELTKVKINSSHKSLTLKWIEWQFNQNFNKKLLKQENRISNIEFQTIINEFSQNIGNKKINFGDIILFIGADDIDNSTNIVSSAIYFGNGIVLEKATLPGNKSITKFSYLKDVENRYKQKILNLRLEYKRIKNNKEFNLATVMQKLKLQDKDLEAAQINEANTTF